MHAQFNQRLVLISSQKRPAPGGNFQEAPVMSTTTEISLRRRKGGCDLGGVNNHIKAFMLHLLKDQRDLLIEVA